MKSPEHTTPLHTWEVPEMTDVLQRTLGQRVVADYAGIESANNVRLVVDGKRVPDQFSTERLRDLAELTETILEIEDITEREVTKNKLLETLSSSKNNN